MKITKRQLRRIISEQVGTDWKEETRKVTGDRGTGGTEANINADMRSINKIVPELMDKYGGGVDEDLLAALYIYIEHVRQELQSGKWSDF